MQGELINLFKPLLKAQNGYFLRLAVIVTTIGTLSRPLEAS